MEPTAPRIEVLGEREREKNVIKDTRQLCQNWGKAVPDEKAT